MPPFVLKVVQSLPAIAAQANEPFIEAGCVRQHTCYRAGQGRVATWRRFGLGSSRVTR